MADYCTNKEVIDTIKTAGDDTIDGNSYKDVIARLISAYSRMIDRYCGREDSSFYVTAAASARYFEGDGDQEILIDDMAAVPTEVAVAEAGDITDYTVWAATDYIVLPHNTTPKYSLYVDRLNGTKTYFAAYPKSVKVTAKWGYSEAIPDTIKNACIIQVTRTLKRAQSGYADTGAIPDLSQLTHTKELDPEVKNMLSGYVRINV